MDSAAKEWRKKTLVAIRGFFGVAAVGPPDWWQFPVRFLTTTCGQRVVICGKGLHRLAPRLQCKPMLAGGQHGRLLISISML